MTSIEQAKKHQQRKLLRFLESGQAAWRSEDHPELDGGAEAWVRGLRKESEKHVADDK